MSWTPERHIFRRQQTVEIHEDLHNEFKAGQYGPFMMAKVIVKYACAFLNSEGGCLYFGIDDHGKVIGCRFDRHAIDQLRLHTAALMRRCTPPIFDDLYKITPQPVDSDSDEPLCVIKVEVKQGLKDVLYKTHENAIFVRRDGCKNEIRDLDELWELARRRLQQKSEEINQLRSEVYSAARNHFPPLSSIKSLSDSELEDRAQLVEDRLAVSRTTVRRCEEFLDELYRERQRRARQSFQELKTAYKQQTERIVELERQQTTMLMSNESTSLSSSSDTEKETPQRARSLPPPKTPAKAPQKAPTTPSSAPSATAPSSAPAPSTFPDASSPLMTLADALRSSLPKDLTAELREEDASEESSLSSSPPTMPQIAAQITFTQVPPLVDPLTVMHAYGLFAPESYTMVNSSTEGRTISLNFSSVADAQHAIASLPWIELHGLKLQGTMAVVTPSKSAPNLLLSKANDEDDAQLSSSSQFSLSSSSSSESSPITPHASSLEKRHSNTSPSSFPRRPRSVRLLSSSSSSSSPSSAARALRLGVTPTRSLVRMEGKRTPDKVSPKIAHPVHHPLIRSTLYATKPHLRRTSSEIRTMRRSATIS